MKPTLHRRSSNGDEQMTGKKKTYRTPYGGDAASEPIRRRGLGAVKKGDILG